MAIYLYAVLAILLSSNITGYRFTSLSSSSSSSSSLSLSVSSLSSLSSLSTSININDVNDVIDVSDKTKYIRTLLIDNYDSYTYNIYQILAEINGLPPIVIYNNDYDSDWSKAVDSLPSFDNIVISPGPGSPDKHSDFGLCKDAILSANVPIFGVCLGHQGIAHAYGGHVVKAPSPMHGRLSSITHTADGLFESIDQHTNVVRYHSLIAQSPLPYELEATAWTDDGIIMALKHKTKPIYGVQFHPESISTACGRKMFSNFKKMTTASIRTSSVASVTSTTSFSNDKNVFDSKPIGFVAQDKPTIDKSKHVTVMRIDSDMSSEVLFEKLYGDHAASFWLDSATAGTTNGKVPSAPKISFMGAIDTPSSVIAEYAEHNKLFIRSKNGSTLQERNIFEYLDEKLKDYADHNVHVEYSNFDLQRGESLPFNFTGGLFGYLGYELRTETTHILTTHNTDGSDRSHQYDYSSTRANDFKANKWVGNLNHPLALFMVPSRYIVYDHSRSLIYVVASAENSATAQADAQDLLTKIESLKGADVKETRIPKLSSHDCGELISDKTSDEYHRAISMCSEHIRMGESYELCLTAQFQGRINEKYTHIEHYKNLRSRNPAPFSCFLHYDVSSLLEEKPIIGIDKKGVALKWMKKGGFSICSSSPERFFSATEDGFIESKPIKGTSRRDLSDSNNDAIIARNLESDEKSRAENLMIVDLLRNDFGRICLPGSVCVPKLMDIETYASVHQLVSTIRGKLSSKSSIVDALVATFPGGSMTGAPKIRTMDIIDDLEGRPRGIYSGALGYIGFNGVTDLNIVIRTALLEDDTITVGAGGAIVAMSDADKEIDEVLLKARAVSASFDRDIKWR